MQQRVELFEDWCVLYRLGSRLGADAEVLLERVNGRGTLDRVITILANDVNLFDQSVSQAYLPPNLAECNGASLAHARK